MTIMPQNDESRRLRQARAGIRPWWQERWAARAGTVAADFYFLARFLSFFLIS